MDREGALFLDEKIIFAENYRVFLKESLLLLKQSKRGFSLATFAKKAGFGSRGFILDVIKGKKRLTARSTPKVIDGLGLKGKLKKLFTALVESEEFELSSQKTSRSETQLILRKLRQQLLDEKKQKLGGPYAPSLMYSDIHFLMIFAALGSLEVGATFEEIVQRTKLPGPRIHHFLEKMKAAEIVKLEAGIFKAANAHIVFDELSRNKSFQSVVLQTLRLAAEEATKKIQNKDNLFFHSVFPINRKKFPQLKVKIKSLLTELIHDNQEENGDHVSILQLSLF